MLFVYFCLQLADLVERKGWKGRCSREMTPSLWGRLQLWTSVVTPGWSLFVLVRCMCGWLQPQRAAGRQITANPSSQEMLWTSLSVSLTLLLFLLHPIFLLPTAKGNRRFPPSLSLALLEAGKVKVLVSQPCPTLYNPMGCSPPGSPVHEILQARILEGVAIPFSRGSSQPRDQTRISSIAGRFFTI